MLSLIGEERGVPRLCRLHNIHYKCLCINELGKNKSIRLTFLRRVDMISPTEICFIIGRDF